MTFLKGFVITKSEAPNLQDGIPINFMVKNGFTDTLLLPQSGPTIFMLQLFTVMMRNNVCDINLIVFIVLKKQNPCLYLYLQNKMIKIQFSTA